MRTGSEVRSGPKVGREWITQARGHRNGRGQRPLRKLLASRGSDGFAGSWRHPGIRPARGESFDASKSSRMGCADVSRTWTQVSSRRIRRDIGPTSRGGRRDRSELAFKRNPGRPKRVVFASSDPGSPRAARALNARHPLANYATCVSPPSSPRSSSHRAPSIPNRASFV